MTPTTIALLLFATMSLAVVTATQVWAARQHRRDMLLAADATSRWRGSSLGSLDRLLERTESGRRIKALLAGAGLGTLSPALFLIAVLSVLVMVFLVVDGAFGTVTGVIALVGTVIGLHRWLERRRLARTEKFISQLPDLARLLANGAQAGLGMRRSIELAARELDEPAASELGQVSSELGVGRSLDTGLRHLQERLPSKELAVLVQTLVIQARAGGTLVTALSHIASTLDARRQLAREAKTASAGAVFTGYVVMVLGIGSVFLVNLMSPGALDAMTTQPLGIAALVVSGGLFAAGYVVIRRLTKVDI